MHSNINVDLLKRASSLNESTSTLTMNQTSSSSSSLKNNKSNRSNSMINSQTTINSQKNVNKHNETISQSLNIKAPQSILTIKNRLLNDLTHAIQLAQKAYLEKEVENRSLTNSDYQVHELCQQFDHLLLFGLKNLEETYWKILVEFTHKNVIKDLDKLLNVQTNLGKGRAWIYHALNDNLMESYLRCFMDNKKMVYKHYHKNASLITDDQALTVLVTLVSGLENVQFKLFNDVPYLDHSCWPTHLRLKRHVVDTLLNTSTQSLTQMVDLNNSLIDSISLSRSPNGLVLSNDSIKTTTTTTTATTTITTKKLSNRKSNRLANNVSLENNNQSINSLDYTNIREKLLNKTNKLENDQLISSSNDSNEIETNKKSIKLMNQIENEIDKLRIETGLLINQTNPSSSNLTNTNNYQLKLSTSLDSQQLAAHSLKASNQFDTKIAHIESYSKIIEDATLNMDAFVKDMSNLYQNYENIYNETPNDDLLNEENLNDNNNNNNNNNNNIDNSLKLNELDDLNEQDSNIYNSKLIDNTQIKTNETDQQILFSCSSLSSLHTNNTNFNTNEDENSSKYDKCSIDSFTSRSNSKNENENSYLDDSTNFQEDFKQEIKIDNNTKLMLSIEILQNGANEDLVKFYQVTRGHNQGEIETIYLMITSYGVYILRQKDTVETTSEINIQNTVKYIKESFINHEQMDYIEVSLSDQSIHFVCINKRLNCWITTASRNLTNYLLENLQYSRSLNKSLKFPKISVFHEATQQKLAIKKFLSNEENLAAPDIDLRGYSLVFWEDQASVVNHMIHKEGTMYYYFKSSGSNSSPEWKKAFFILKNDVLTQYKTQNDKRPTQVIKLNGEDFSGCRKNTKSSRPNTIELILNSNVLYLSTKNEIDASDWLQCFCKIISLGNFHTDVPSLSCLPCCSVITSNKLYLCHEDLSTGFYRLLESIKLQEINRISFDNDNPFYCILHDDIDNKKLRYWFVYFIDRNERNEFITCFKEAWENMFQVALTIEKCKSSEMRKRCIKGVRLIHKTLDTNNPNALD